MPGSRRLEWLHSKVRIGATLALLLVAAIAGGIWFVAAQDDEAEQSPRTTELNDVVSALRDGELDAVTALLSFKSLPCGTPVAILDRENPGPQCRETESRGTLIAVLPIVGCDVTFVRSGDAPAAVRRSLERFELYGAVKLRQPISHSPYYALQEGVYGVVGKVGAGRLGLMVSVSATGEIVNLWPGCGEFAAGLIDDRFREELLFGPG